MKSILHGFDGGVYEVEYELDAYFGLELKNVKTLQPAKTTEYINKGGWPRCPNCNDELVLSGLGNWCPTCQSYRIVEEVNRGSP